MTKLRPREETFRLESGTGRLEVRGTGAACGLFLDGMPVVYHWNDNGGSVGQDVCYFGEAASQGAEQLRKIMEGGPDEWLPLADQFLPLLSQFPPAEYVLTLAPEPDESYLFDRGEYSDEYLPGTVLNYYPYDGVTFVPTLPYERMDEGRILEYMYRIEAGARHMVAVTATVPGAWCEFVLDGHHKLFAHALCRVPCWRLRVTCPPRPFAAGDWPKGRLLAPPRSWTESVEWARRDHGGGGGLS